MGVWTDPGNHWLVWYSDNGKPAAGGEAQHQLGAIKLSLMILRVFLDSPEREVRSE